MFLTQRVARVARPLRALQQSVRAASTKAVVLKEVGNIAVEEIDVSASGASGILRLPLPLTSHFPM